MISVIRTVYIVCFFLALPVGFRVFCGGLRGWRLAAAAVFYSALSWALTNGCIFLCYMIDPATLRGPEAALALFAGWLYLWVTSLPVFCCCRLYRILRSASRRGPVGK